MPTRDIRSNLKPQLIMNEIINSDTTTNSSELDTADLDGGVKFNFICPVYALGTFTPEIQESDVSGSGFTAVADKNLIPQSGAETGAVINAATVALATIPSIGVFGTKRFLKVVITSASSADGTIVITSESTPEVLKAV